MNAAEAENRGLDQDVFALIRDLYDRQACHQTMGIKIMYLGPGAAGIRKSPQASFATDGGRVHGGVIAALADIVMGAAAATINGQLYRTVEMNLNFLEPVLEETGLTAQAAVVHPGYTIAVIEGLVCDHEGRLIAKSRGTYIRDTKSKFER